MPRAIWKGSISFGLVQIPVGLYSAENSEELHFHLLDKRDMQPVRYERVNEKTKKEVPWNQVVKGYEHAKGQFVVVTDQDFKHANVEATQTIDILTFVDERAVSPVYFEKPYYLAPDKRGARPYALLRETMRKTGKIGIATVVIRTRQHPAALMVMDDCLVLELLRFGHELREPKELELPSLPADEAVGKSELAMAEKLVEGLAGEFDPKALKDTYRDDLVKLLKKKAKTGNVETVYEQEKKPAPAKVVDLMELLRQSIAEGGGKKTTRAAGSGKKRAAAKKPDGTAKKAANQRRKSRAA